MITVRQEQMDALVLDCSGGIEELTLDYLERNRPALIRGIPPFALREMVGNGIARAGGHGLKSAYDLVTFVMLMFEIAPNFDTHPVIRQGLGDLRSIPSKHMDELLEIVPEEAWKEAYDNFDVDAWFPDGGEESDS
jgi:hypothetical protein